MRFLIVILGVMLIILAGCAKANNPADTSVMELMGSIPTVGNPLNIDVSPTKIYVAEDLAGVSIINRSNFQRTWYTQVIGRDGTIRDLYRIKNISAVDNEHLLFVNEVDQADEIQIINTLEHPDTLTIIDTAIGGTGGITDMKFAAITDTTSLYSIEGTIVNGKEFQWGGYSRELDAWYGFTQNIALPTFLGGFALTNQYIYLAAKQRGLMILDRTSGAIVSEFDLPGEANKIAIQGNYAYVACRQEGLQVIDITNINNPIKVYSFDTTGYASSISVNDHYALVGSGGGGYYLFDILNPHKIRLLENNVSIGYVNDVVIDGSDAIVATRDQGILVYRLP